MYLYRRPHFNFRVYALIVVVCLAVSLLAHFILPLSSD